jgi:asparagine synthase (glutamine-hydrolysing)
MRRYISDCLLSETSAVNKYFNKNYIAQMVAEHQAGRQEHLRHIYLLIAFELWHEQFIRTPATTVTMQAASIA